MDDYDELVGEFRGVVSVTRADEHLYQAANGYRDLANQIPNRLQTRFATASLGKGFVAVGILNLVAAGRVRLHDRLGSILPWDWGAIDPQITVFQLLTHTSGLPDYFDEAVLDDYEELWRDFPNYRVRRNADLLPLFQNKPMMYPAGTRFQYNNSGYVVLALILEEITGQCFDDFLAAAVFEPAGMKNTGYFELDRLPSNCAHNYIPEPSAPGGYRTNIYSVDAKGTGAGGAFTTAADLAAFWQAFTTKRLLDDEHTSLLLEPHAQEPGGNSYGLGVWLDSDLNPYLQGFDPGVSALSHIDLSSGKAISLLSNFGDDPWEIASGMH